MTDSEWKTWPGFSKYEASHRGRIRNRRTGKVLAVTVDDDGYERLNLYADDGTRPKLSVARCVLSAHDRAPEPGEESCHGPGGRRDNRYPENIRWDTREGNEHDKVAAGTTPKPNPTHPCRDGCGALVMSEGRRCLDCLARVRVDVVAMLGRGVNLMDVADHFGYGEQWTWRLATEGGCTLSKRQALTQQPKVTQRALATLRRQLRRDAGRLVVTHRDG
jgi:hypothetical protein